MMSVPNSPLQHLFNEASQQILKGRWVTLKRSKRWQEVLPCPDLSILPKPAIPNSIARAVGLHNSSMHEQKLTWANWAMEFYNTYSQRLNGKLQDMERHLTGQIDTWNSYHPTRNGQLAFDEVFREWLTSVDHLSLIDFSQLHIGAHTAHDFLTPKFDALKERYEMPPVVQLAATPLKSMSLTLRQIALLHVYQNKPIERGPANKIANQFGHQSGEKLYNLYNELQSTPNRTGVEGKQVKPRIKDIEAVLPQLATEQRQQAEAELTTIRKKL